MAFGRDNNSAPGAMPPPPPGAPRPPMAPGSTPTAPMAGAPRPPMPTPPGAPRPPMAPGLAPTAPMAGAPRPPMPTPPGAPRPPMAPGSTPTAPLSPSPSPAAPAGFGVAPRPMGPTPSPSTPSFGSPSGPSFGGYSSPTMSGPSMSNGMGMANRGTEVSMSDMASNVSLDTFLGAKKGYKPVRSAISGSRVSYEQYCAELTFEYFDSILRGQNLLERKTDIVKIKKNLVFALSNTKDLPDRQRDILYNAAIKFVDFLKAVVYYPEKGVINDEIVAYMPILKDAAHAFRGFLLKNR